MAMILILVKATVVLNANMAFLSIQSVDQGGDVVAQRSPAQIASYVSILGSIASTFVGLWLIKNHRKREDDTNAAAATITSCARCGNAAWPPFPLIVK